VLLGPAKQRLTPGFSDGAGDATDGPSSRLVAGKMRGGSAMEEA
jgi:hypothetical protein